MTLDVWAEFEIKQISPSQIIKANDDLGFWYASARGKVYDDAGPAAWRGEAVEGGLHHWLLKRGAPGVTAHEIFAARAHEYAKAHDGELHPDHDKYEEEIGRTLDRAIECFEKEGLTKFQAYQPWLEGFFPGTNIKCVGKPDWTFEGFPVDLKTASQLPTEEPKPEHAIASAFYAIARGDSEARIPYISTAEKPKTPYRVHVMDAAMIQRYAHAAAQTVRRLETTLLAAIAMTEFEAVDKETALAELCRPNPLARGGGFYDVWKPEYAERARAAVPAWS